MKKANEIPNRTFYDVIQEEDLIPLGSVTLTEPKSVCGVFPSKGGATRFEWGMGAKEPTSKTGEYPIEIYDVQLGNFVLIRRKGRPDEIIYPNALIKATILDDQLIFNKARETTSTEDKATLAKKYDKQKSTLEKKKEELKQKLLDD